MYILYACHICIFHILITIEPSKLRNVKTLIAQCIIKMSYMYHNFSTHPLKTASNHQGEIVEIRE